MTPFDTLPVSPVPTFCVAVQDDSLCRRMDLRAGDLILCDTQTDKALYVVVLYVDDDEFHVCTQLPSGQVFDEQTQQEAPADAVILGRIAYVLRRWIPQEETA